MKKMIHLLILALAGMALSVPPLHAEDSCGDEGITCGDDQTCCEHVVAIFSGDAPAAPSYVQGKCIPKGARCGEFWCGNRHCEGGFFGDPTVCCINQPYGATPQYACAHSELSCPGNTQQLSIRDRTPDRVLQGS